MKFLMFILTCLEVSAAPRLRSANALTTQVTPTQFFAELKAGHHFNEKAPNGIQVGSQFHAPRQMDRQKLVIDLDSKSTQSVAYLYVCDDAVTYCEVHSISLGAKTGKKIKSTSITKSKFHNGFLVNDFEGALKKAKIEKKMLFVDFGARWCPACIRLEDEIFSSPQFSKKTKSFVKVKIDVDLFSNSPILDRYEVKGFPTVLILTSEGEEIIRFMDYQPMDLISQFLDNATQFPVSISNLEKRERTPEIQQALWKRYFHSDKFDKALHIMESLPAKPKEYWSTKIEASDSSEKVLRQALEFEPESTRSLIWRQKLAEKLSPKSSELKKLSEDSWRLTEKFLNEPSILTKALETDSIGEFTGLEKFYVSFLNADIADATGVRTEEAWNLVVQQGEDAKVSSKQPGAALRLLSAMIQAKKYDAGLNLVENLLKQNPDDGDLQRRKLRVLVELKRFSEAIAIGQNALKNSYGINEFYVVEPLAKAYLGTQQSEKAKELLGQYLSRNEINFGKMKRFKKSFEELLATDPVKTPAN